jgi:signal transduction histidine kinase
MDEVLEVTPSQASDADGLARTLAVVGLQVSQVADELHHAARTVTAAEERVRDIELRGQVAEERAQTAEDRAQTAEVRAQSAEENARVAEERANAAEARARTAEEQLAESATKNAELLDMLQAAREGQTEAEERCRRAEQRLQIASDRESAMAQQMEEIDPQVRASDPRPPVTVIVDDERTALQDAVAADVRRPLRSILGLTLALKHADPSSPDGKDMVKQLATNARRLDRLVGEMLDLDKIARGAYQLNLRRTDVAALAQRVVDESPDLANRDVKMKSERATLEIDPALVEHMLETLLSNAERRTAPGNPLWVHVSSAQGGVVIAVDDTGPEVPPAQRNAMFAALSDDAPARHKSKGATGLSLLARLAEIHGGRAWVEERSGGGASFRVLLPSSRPASEAGADGSAAVSASQPIDLHLPEAPSDDTVVYDTTPNGHVDGSRDFTV